MRLAVRRPAHVQEDAALLGELRREVVLPRTPQRPQVDARVAERVVLGGAVPVEDVQLQRLGEQVAQHAAELERLVPLRVERLLDRLALVRLTRQRQLHVRIAEAVAVGRLEVARPLQVHAQRAALEHVRRHPRPRHREAQRALRRQRLRELVHVAVQQRVETHAHLAEQVVLREPVLVEDLELQPARRQLLQRAGELELLVPHRLERLVDHLALLALRADARLHVRVALAVEVGALEPDALAQVERQHALLAEPRRVRGRRRRRETLPWREGRRQ